MMSRFERRKFDWQRLSESWKAKTLKFQVITEVIQPTNDPQLCNLQMQLFIGIFSEAIINLAQADQNTENIINKNPQLAVELTQLSSTWTKSKTAKAWN